MENEDPSKRVSNAGGMLSVPDEILQQLVKYCVDAGLGFSSSGKDDMCMFLIGVSEDPP
jgi:hypothetical protein